MRRSSIWRGWGFGRYNRARLWSGTASTSSASRAGWRVAAPPYAHCDARTTSRNEDSWALAARIFAPCYIDGWSAASHWNLTEQLFRSTFVVTRRPVRRSDVVVGSTAFHLARQMRKSMGGLTTVWRGNAKVSVSGIERTLVDACVNPSWVGGGRHLVAIFRSAVAEYARAHRGTGYVRFDPAVRGRGRLSRRWGLWLNATLPDPAT